MLYFFAVDENHDFIKDWTSIRWDEIFLQRRNPRMVHHWPYLCNRNIMLSCLLCGERDDPLAKMDAEKSIPPRTGSTKMHQSLWFDLPGIIPTNIPPKRHSSLLTFFIPYVYPLTLPTVASALFQGTSQFNRGVLRLIGISVFKLRLVGLRLWVMGSNLTRG